MKYIIRFDIPRIIRFIDSEAGEHKAITTHRIEATKDFGDVKKGELGGFVEGDFNLSDEGDCWIYDDSLVCNGGTVAGDAKVMYSSLILSKSIIDNQAIVDSSRLENRCAILDQARIENTLVEGFLTMSHNAELIDCVVQGINTIGMNEAYVQEHIINKGRVAVNSFDQSVSANMLTGINYVDSILNFDISEDTENGSSDVDGDLVNLITDDIEEDPSPTPITDDNMDILETEANRVYSIHDSPVTIVKNPEGLVINNLTHFYHR